MPQNYALKIRKRPLDEEGMPAGPYEFVNTDEEAIEACVVVFDEAGDQEPTTAAPLNAAAGEWTIAVPNYQLPSLVDSGGEGHWVAGYPTEFKIDTIHH